MGRRAGAVSFTKGVPAGDQRDGLFVVHGHTGESLTNIMSRSGWDRFTVRPFRVHINQSHLHGGKRIFEIPVTCISLVAEPGILAAPIYVLFRLPYVLTPPGEAEGLQSHRLDGTVAGKDHEVGPGYLFAVFLFDGPDQAACLV